MKKVPLFIQAMGDTLFFLPYLIQTPISLSRKLRVVAAWLKITLILFLYAPLAKRRREDVLSFKANFFDYRTFHLLFRHMFIRNDYYFKADINSPLIIDCGANIGFATMYFKWLYPKSEIHAFEPDPLTFQLLQKNILENRLSNVVCHCAAISNFNGEADFYIDSNKPGWIQMSLLPRDFKETVKVRTLSLSSYIFEKLSSREIDFLKLDLEGVEFEVLQELAASGCLRQIREIFIEYHHRIGNAPSTLARFVKILEENGFEYDLDTFYTNRFGNDKFQCVNFHARRIIQNPTERP